MITYESICEKIGGDYFELAKEYNRKIDEWDGLTEDCVIPFKSGMEILNDDELDFMHEYIVNRNKNRNNK